MLTKDDVLAVAKLARIKLGADELERFQGQLEDVLKLFEKVANIDVADATETSQVTGLANITRKDEVSCDDNRRPCSRGELLNNTPCREGNNIIVPKIISNK